MGSPKSRRQAVTSRLPCRLHHRSARPPPARSAVSRRAAPARRGAAAPAPLPDTLEQRLGRVSDRLRRGRHRGRLLSLAALRVIRRALRVCDVDPVAADNRRPSPAARATARGPAREEEQRHDHHHVRDPVRRSHHRGWPTRQDRGPARRRALRLLRRAARRRPRVTVNESRATAPAARARRARPPRPEDAAARGGPRAARARG